MEARSQPYIVAPTVVSSSTSTNSTSPSDTPQLIAGSASYAPVGQGSSFMGMDGQVRTPYQAQAHQLPGDSARDGDTAPGTGNPPEFAPDGLQPMDNESNLSASPLIRTGAAWPEYSPTPTEQPWLTEFLLSVTKPDQPSAQFVSPLATNLDWGFADLNVDILGPIAARSSSPGRLPVRHDGLMMAVFPEEVGGAGNHPQFHHSQVDGGSWVGPLF